MIDWLEAIDRSIVLAVNSLHSPWLDERMWIISEKITWIPLYLLILYMAFKNFGARKTLLFLVLVIASVALSDMISSLLIKNFVARYRPSHHALLTHRLHFYEINPGEFYKGGQYGFVSSHAANFFALAVFVGLSLRRYYNWIFPLMLFIALIICFSRLYLGVHYLSDLIGGALIGSLIAYTVWRLWWKKNLEIPRSAPDYKKNN